jgi:glycosyltransferase involved in cell wall biosynthesis
MGYRATCIAHPRFGVPAHSSEQLSQAGADLLLLRPGRGSSPITVLRVIAALNRVHPDVVIAHSGELVGLIAPLKRLYGDPQFIFVKRGFRTPWGVWATFLHVALGYVDAVAAVSGAVARFWALDQPKWDPSRLFVLPNGIRIPSSEEVPPRSALREELGLPMDARLVGTVGRMDWSKGHQYLIRALPMILKRVPQVHLVLAGDGPYLADLQRLATDIGLQHRVHFLGWREDIYTALAAMDVFVHPTLLEGPRQRARRAPRPTAPVAPDLGGEPFGRAVVEASAVGRPVVATDAGGHREVIVHGETGVLIPPADSRAIGDAVVGLLNDPGKSRAIGQAARERACREYSLEALGARYHRLIQRLLAERSQT